MLTKVMKYVFFLRFNVFDVVSLWCVIQLANQSLWYVLLIFPLTFVSAWGEREFHWKNQ